MALRLEIRGDDLRREFRGIIRRSRNIRPANSAVANMMRESILENFRVGGRPAWPPRKDSKPHPLLVLTGALRNSIAPQANNRRASVVSTILYGPTHQFGRGPIPARPFMVLQSGDEREAVEILERYILGK